MPTVPPEARWINSFFFFLALEVSADRVIDFLSVAAPNVEIRIVRSCHWSTEDLGGLADR